MKKLLSFLALALCFVACQNESVEVVSNGDLADVVLTIDAPELGVTRADGDFMEDGTTPKNAKNSAYGAIDFFDGADWNTYDLRYILEVYAENEDGTGTPIYRERMVNCLDKYAPTTFALRLVPNRTYKFVVFADFVAEGNAKLTEPADKLAIEDLYYNTSDLRNVTAITTTVNPDTKVAKWGAMNEARDAYFVTENVEINNSLTKDLTLTRPFAKLRVIATDLDYIAGYSKPGYVEVAYHTEKVFKSFNAVNGNLNAAEMTGNELAYGFEVKKDEPYTAGYDEFSTNQTLFTDYLLAVEGEQTTVNFTIAVYEDANKTRKIHEHNFNTQIPIQRNHLTTLIGDILTTQANIEIKIDDNFADEFVIGVGDDNTTTINSWGAGQLNANGDYTFVVEGENDFEVTVNGASVVNQKLTAGDYVLAEDAEKDENGNIVAGQKTFTVKSLQANETTRALVAVEVIGGKMNVQAVDDNYKITLDLVLQFAEEKDVRHAIYTYEGTIAFDKVLDTPKVEAAVEGNVVTLTWDAVADATEYTITGFAEEPVVTDKTTYEFTGKYETEYTFSVVASNDTLNSQPYNGTVKTEAEPVVEPEEPTDLATPVVNASVKGNVVTLTWATVENAGSYNVFIGNEADGISETVTPEEGATEVTFVKEGLDYSTEYTFTVYAIPADTEQYATSKAVVVVETEAEPTTEPEVLAEIDADAYYIFKQATEMKGGKWYAIVYDNKAATGLTSNYGYLKVTEAASRANGISLPATCAYGFLTTDGGYTIQQFDSKYMYQTGSYDSFNVNATLPADGGVWSVTVDGNEYTITNNTMSKFVQYDSAYDSYGCYATSKGSLPTLYELVEVDNTPMILDLSTSKLSFSSVADSKTITVTTYGTATLSVSKEADWVSTSIAENVVTVTAEANSGDARETTITITYGEDSKEVTIAQAEYVEEGTTVTYTDTLTSDMFAATSTTYVEFSNVAGTNGAVYAGKSSKSTGGYIQLRSSKSEDGIVTTTSGGKVKKVVVEWDESTTEGRTLDVYVSNKEYQSATELYGTELVGEKAGNIVKGTSTELVIDGDYNYVGLRSNNGAMYIKSITITYEK